MEMKAVQVSVILLFALSGVQRQAAALPASTLLVRVGEDATLQCPLLDASNGTGPATLSWYRKAAGHGPTLLVSISPANGSTLRTTEGFLISLKRSEGKQGTSCNQFLRRRRGGMFFWMDFLKTFIILLGCWTVQSSPNEQSVHFSMVFSDGTHLLVEVKGEIIDFRPVRNTTAGSPDGPSIQILRSERFSQDPESPHLLVCLLKGLTSPWQHVLWWIDDTPVTSAGAKGPWTKSDWGYSATSVWEVSAAAWKPTSSYWCGNDPRRRSL